jgi:hypothetical protein
LHSLRASSGTCGWFSQWISCYSWRVPLLVGLEIVGGVGKRRRLFLATSGWLLEALATLIHCTCHWVTSLESGVLRCLAGVPWGASDLRVTPRNHLSVGRHNQWRSLSVHKWTPGEQKCCVSYLPVIGLHIVLLSILIDCISSWWLATSSVHRRYKNHNPLSCIYIY